MVPFLLWLNVTSNDYGNVQQFIEWFGVPYGLLLALVLVNVWTQHDTTDRAFDREADAILALYNTFCLIEDRRLEKSAATEIKKYIEHVRRFYTEEYKENQNRLREVGDDLLNDIRKLIGKLIKRRKDKVITAELLRLVNELIDDRGDRLSYSKQRMPKPVLSLAIISSILWLAPFFVLKFESFLVGAFFLGGVTFVVVSILLIVYDLDFPFTGMWVIELDTWEDLLNKIK
ncbi:MAG TPA: hypothetical protein VJ327_09705 [Patescibacteria group bacterium]|nr:hypothetical protein [Patescibacteria group bacterium]